MTDNSFSFATLSPGATWDALSSIDIRPDSGLQALNSYENRVYLFKDEQQKSWVVKFYRPHRWSDEQILEEHAFASKLQQANIPVVAPKIIDKKSLFYYQDFRFALFPFMGGRSFEQDNDNHIEAVGSLLGKMHAIGKNSVFCQRPTLGLDEYLHEPKSILAGCQLIPQNVEQRFFTALNALITIITPHWQQDWQQIALHGDCHAGNILWRDAPLFVDLDDARNGPAMQDIWMLLHGDDKEKRYQLDIISEAYSEYSDFPIEQLKLIECLRGLRMIQQTAWIAKRWQDSAFPKAFPWFKEASYWESQILAFERQGVCVEQPPLSLHPQW